MKTTLGGAFALLVLLLLAPTGAGATAKFTTLYSFCAVTQCHDGSAPFGGLVMDAADNLYGTALGGGAGGLVFELSPNADKSVWTETVLHSFAGPNGSSPMGRLVLDTSGNVYGVTSFDSTGGGLVYEVMSDADHTFKVLYRFCSQPSCTDGLEPREGLTYAGQSTGALYDGTSSLFGTTHGGGTNNTGVVFSMGPSGNKWLEGVIYTAGPHESAGMAADGGSGGLYFTTTPIIASAKGSIYVRPPAGSVTKFWDFCQGTCHDGSDPQGVIVDQLGNVFGATHADALHSHGDVFKIAFNKRFHSYHAFCTANNCLDGDYAQAVPMMTASGQIWGTTRYGGGHNIDNDHRGGGTIYRIGSGVYKKLYSFCAKPSCLDGAGPIGSLVTDGSGVYYGVTLSGGANGSGSVFSFKP